MTLREKIDIAETIAQCLVTIVTGFWVIWRTNNRESK